LREIFLKNESVDYFFPFPQYEVLDFLKTKSKTATLKIRSINTRNNPTL